LTGKISERPKINKKNKNGSFLKRSEKEKAGTVKAGLLSEKTIILILNSHPTTHGW